MWVAGGAAPGRGRFAGTTGSPLNVPSQDVCMGQACNKGSCPMVERNGSKQPGPGAVTTALMDQRDEYVSFSQKWAEVLGETGLSCRLPGMPIPSTQLTVAVEKISPEATLAQEVAEAPRSARVDETEYGMTTHKLGGGFQFFDMNLHEGVQSRQNVARYCRLWKDHVDLHVSTACFAVWRKHKKTNGHAKVIPAIPSADPEDVRIFFFDDNLELDGGEQNAGICNLRDVHTGEFVEFGNDKNGFCRSHAARHTVIQHSTTYRNVLVKANILDAMEDPEYFISIIKRFSLPHERLIVFMDVNSTIVCNDTVQGKGLSNTLLSTMFEFVDFRPAEPFEVVFNGHPPVRIEKKMKLKQLVKEITSNSHEAYGSFWTEDNCWRLFAEVAAKGEVRWEGQDKTFTLEASQELFKEYLVSLEKVISKDGIAGSWFRVYDALKGRHTVVLNSFGVDTRKVILATIPDERSVLQVTVNYALWEERDVQKFEGQFKT